MFVATFGSSLIGKVTSLSAAQPGIFRKWLARLRHQDLESSPDWDMTSNSFGTQRLDTSMLSDVRSPFSGVAADITPSI